MITTQHKAMAVFLPIFCLACLSLSLCGCGGDDASASSHPAAQTKTVNGTLLDSSQSAQSGDRVVYDSGTSHALTAQTDSAGKYQLILPLSSITGTDTLTFFDSAGHELETVPVTLTVDTTPQSVSTTLAPPNPPTGV